MRKKMFCSLPNLDSKRMCSALIDGSAVKRRLQQFDLDSEFGESFANTKAFTNLSALSLLCAAIFLIDDW